MQRLTFTARRLFVSYFLSSFGDPIFGIFTNVYLWRENQSPLLITIYNLCVFIGLPIGFFIAMKLSSLPLWLRYCLGGICEVLVIVLLFQLSSVNAVVVALLGILFGMSAGMYWFTRNLFTWRLVRHRDRLFFASREWIIGVIMSFILPLAIGWVISSGIKHDWFVPQTAYQILSVALIGIFALAGFFVIGIQCFKKGLHRTHFHLNSIWKRHRSLVFVTGIAEGMSVLVPVIAIFQFIGLENAAGTITAVASLVSGVVVTIIGNRAKSKNEPLIVFAHTLMSITGYITFALLYNKAGIILFFIFNALSNGLKIGHTALVNDTLDRVVGKHVSVTYIFDQEVFSNGGRVVAICIFLIAYLYNPNDALRYGILVPVLTQIVYFVLSTKQIQAIKK